MTRVAGLQTTVEQVMIKMGAILRSMTTFTSSRIADDGKNYIQEKGPRALVFLSTSMDKFERVVDALGSEPNYILSNVAYLSDVELVNEICGGVTIIVDLDSYCDLEYAVEELIQFRKINPDAAIVIMSRSFRGMSEDSHRYDICDVSIRFPFSASIVREAVEMATARHSCRTAG